MRIIKLVWIAVLVNTAVSVSTRKHSNNIPSVSTLEESIIDQDEKISSNAAEIDKFSNIYSIQDGKNRTHLHHIVNSQNHSMAVVLLESIILNGGKIEEAFPKGRLVLEYVFFTDKGTPQYSEHLLALTRLLLRHTKTSRRKEKGGTLTALEVGIKAMVHPRILQFILVQGNFPADYDPRYPCSPLSMLMLSKIKSEYEIEDAIKIFWESAANFTEIAPCLWLDPQKKVTALNAVCLLESYKPLDQFQAVTIRKAKSLIKFGANPLQVDDFGEPFENAILNYKSFLSGTLRDPSSMDRLDICAWELSYYIILVLRLVLRTFKELTSRPISILTLIFTILAIYFGYKFYSKKKSNIKHKPRITTFSAVSLLNSQNATGTKRKKSITTTVSKEDREEERKGKDEKRNETKSPSIPIQNSLENLLNSTYIDNDIKQALIEYDQKHLLDLNLNWGDQKDTLLMHLIRGKYLNSVKFVIHKIMSQQPYLINEINNQNQTALMVACLTNQSNIINHLLDEEKVSNLYTNLRDEQGDNALAIWLKQAGKQKFACAKKLVQRGCEITHAVRSAWGFMALESTQQEELERLAAECSSPPIKSEPMLELEVKKIVGAPKNSRRKSLETAKTIEKKDATVKEKPRRISLPTKFPVQQSGIEESKPNGRLQFQKNHRLFYLCIRNCQYLISSFNRNATTPIEMFCRHAALLVHLLDLAKKIDHYIKYNNPDTDKSASRDFIYYIRHSVIPPLLKASLLSSAIPAVEEMADQFVQWIPSSLKENKLEEKLSLSEKESQDASALLETLISFFEEKNQSGLRLKESKLFNIITNFHDRTSGSEFAAAKHEDYVNFALPIINEIYSIYKSMPGHQHILVLLLYSCGDAWVEYGNVNQSKDFSYFVKACRISLRNRLMHDPNFSFLEVTPEEICYLCELAKKAINTQNLALQAEWHNTSYGRNFIKGIASALSACGLFAGCTDNNIANFPGTIVLDYLGFSIDKMKAPTSQLFNTLKNRKIKGSTNFCNSNIIINF